MHSEYKMKLRIDNDANVSFRMQNSFPIPASLSRNIFDGMSNEAKCINDILFHWQ